MSSLRTFLSEIIDYAGLFPPAQLSMQAAVANYAAYRREGDRDLLGRFIVPAARMEEFGEAAQSVLPQGDDADQWHVSAIATGDLAAVKKTLLEFNCSHWRGSERGHATVDSIEIPVRDKAEIDAATAAFPDFFEIFLEVAPEPDPELLINAIGKAGARAKIRTGGVEPDMFPPATAITRFIAACHRRGVKFKATAGLHHALRASYPLTYESGSAEAPMFGYLNVFLAAAFIHSGFSEEIAAGVLEAGDPQSILFDDDGVVWDGHRVPTNSLRAAREQLALSFGSCSFREPVDEARQLGFL